MLRLAAIGIAVLGLLARIAHARFSGPARRALPGRLKTKLERLGPPFVKLGQALSLRHDLLPDDVIEALQGLQDDVTGFAGDLARIEVEAALGRPVSEVFTEFEESPFAAASIAQVHRARLGERDIIVKVRRPGIRAQIDRDMRLLVIVLRNLERVFPIVRRFGAVALAREIWSRMQAETDLLREARNVRRFAEAFRNRPDIYVPDVEETLCTETMLVQDFSQGRRIDGFFGTAEGRRLAEVLVDIYLDQFFVMGVFHGDPHPGNLFILDDGRLCFHDFGVVGLLTMPMRRALATFMLALAQQDEDWLVDAAADLGVLSTRIDRNVVRDSVGAILAEYAGRPLSEWSLGDVMLRIMRLGREANAKLPANLAILARTALLVEHVLRGLDKDITVISALGPEKSEFIADVLAPRAEPAELLRLKSEATMTAQHLPTLAAQWLKDARREGGRIPISLRIASLQGASRPIVGSMDRLALALVALGLYVAASLLMQHSVGPRVFGQWPLFAVIGYALAIWLTLRIVRGARAAERDFEERD